MEAVVPQAPGGRPVVVRRLDRAAEGTRVTEPGIVDEHKQDVGGPRRRLDVVDQGPVRLGTTQGLVGDSPKGEAGDREDGPVDGVRHVNLFRRVSGWRTD